jgi:hypothetical protein
MALLVSSKAGAQELLNLFPFRLFSPSTMHVWLQKNQTITDARAELPRRIKSGHRPLFEYRSHRQTSPILFFLFLYYRKPNFSKCIP